MIMITRTIVIRRVMLLYAGMARCAIWILPGILKEAGIMTGSTRGTVIVILITADTNIIRNAVIIFRPIVDISDITGTRYSRDSALDAEEDTDIITTGTGIIITGMMTAKIFDAAKFVRRG